MTCLLGALPILSLIFRRHMGWSTWYQMSAQATPQRPSLPSLNKKHLLHLGRPCLCSKLAAWWVTWRLRRTVANEHAMVLAERIRRGWDVHAGLVAAWLAFLRFKAVTSMEGSDPRLGFGAKKAPWLQVVWVQT